MSISSSSFMAGYTGCLVVSGTTTITGQFRAFVVNSNAVVAAITDKDDVNILTTTGLSGATINQGMFYCVPDGNFIKTISLTSGSIILYNA